jgi:hypothetical protein
MINVNFVFLGAALGLLGSAFYIRDTLRGVTHPNTVSWFLWGAAPMLAFAAEVRSGVGLESLMTFTVGFAPLLVVGASLVAGNAVWHLTRLDIVCGTLSIMGTAVWIITRQGLVAIAAAILADALAGVPTIVKSWKAPETESVSAYLGAFANATITLLTVTTVTAAVIAFPIYITFIAGLEVILIGGRLGPRVRAMRGVPTESSGSTL